MKKTYIIYYYYILYNIYFLSKCDGKNPILKPPSGAHIDAAPVRLTTFRLTTSCLTMPVHVVFDGTEG